MPECFHESKPDEVLLPVVTITMEFWISPWISSPPLPQEVFQKGIPPVSQFVSLANLLTSEEVLKQVLKPGVYRKLLIQQILSQIAFFIKVKLNPSVYTNFWLSTSTSGSVWEPQLHKTKGNTTFCGISADKEAYEITLLVSPSHSF